MQIQNMKENQELYVLVYLATCVLDHDLFWKNDQTFSFT